MQKVSFSPVFVILFWSIFFLDLRKHKSDTGVILPTTNRGHLMPRAYYAGVPKSRHKCVQTSVRAVYTDVVS